MLDSDSEDQQPEWRRRAFHEKDNDDERLEAKSKLTGDDVEKTRRGVILFSTLKANGRFQLTEPIRRWLKKNDAYITKHDGVSQLEEDESLRKKDQYESEEEQRESLRELSIEHRMHDLYATGSFEFNMRLRKNKELDAPDKELGERRPAIADLLEDSSLTWDQLLIRYANFIRRAPKLPNIHLWRGSTRFGNFHIGDVLVDPAFTSFSTNFMRAYRYYYTRNLQEKSDFRCCLFHLFVPAGLLPAVYDAREEQVIFAPGIEFEVVTLTHEYIKIYKGEDNLKHTAVAMLLGEQTEGVDKTYYRYQNITIIGLAVYQGRRRPDFVLPEEEEEVTYTGPPIDLDSLLAKVPS